MQMIRSSKSYDYYSGKTRDDKTSLKNNNNLSREIFSREKFTRWISHEIVTMQTNSISFKKKWCDGIKSEQQNKTKNGKSLTSNEFSRLVSHSFKQINCVHRKYPVVITGSCSFQEKRGTNSSTISIDKHLDLEHNRASHDSLFSTFKKWIKRCSQQGGIQSDDVIEPAGARVQRDGLSAGHFFSA